MIRFAVAGILIANLAACGGRSRQVEVAFEPLPVEAAEGTVSLPFARGPIQQACEADGRRAASQALCGCVQAVADEALSNSQQRRGTRYFNDPAALQEVRQSDNASNEKFWQAWKAFGARAEEVCGPNRS